MSKLTTKQDVPDGTYEGLWSAYQVVYVVDGQFIEAECDTGVRGINCPCHVIVKDGAATVTYHKMSEDEWREAIRKRNKEKQRKDGDA